MKKNNIGYLLREGFRGVFLHGFMSFAAICVTVACLIIMGSFCLILYNTSAMVKELEQINALGTTVRVVTHERELVNRFTKRVVAISEGRIISDGMDGYYLNEEE